MSLEIGRRCEKEHCDQECERTSYILNARFAKFPSKDGMRTLRHLVGHNGTYEYMWRNLAQQVVKPGALQVDLKYNWVNAIGGVGGMFGLFVGASMMTLFEVIELIGEISLTLYNYYRSRGF